MRLHKSINRIEGIVLGPEGFHTESLSTVIEPVKKSFRDIGKHGSMVVELRRSENLRSGCSAVLNVMKHQRR